MKKRILIIGGGIGGLGAACLLAVKGHEVIILEKSNYPGGCCRFEKKSDYSFNWGADYITSLNLLKSINNSAGLDFDNAVELIPLDPNIRFFGKDQDCFDFTADKKRLVEEIKRINPVDMKNYIDLDNKYNALLQNSFSKISEEPLLKLNDKFNLAPALIKLRMLPNISKFTSTYVNNEFLQKIFSSHPLLVGSDPKSTNYFHQLNPFLFENQQFYYPVGGMQSIVENLIQILNSFGSKIIYNSEVSEILIQKHKVIGLRLIDGSISPGDTVISDADIMLTNNSLLPERYKSKLLKTDYKASDFSSSLFVLMLVVSDLNKETELAQHNIILDSDLDQFSDDLFINHELSTENIFTIHIPTQKDRTLAPQGHQIIKIVAPVPGLFTKTDWKSITWLYRKKLIDYIENRFSLSLRSHILYEEYLGPEYFKDKLNYYNGCVFSLQPKLDQTFLKRPNNPVDIINGLYFVGNGTHPGASVSGVLSSAKIAAELIDAT